MTERLHFHFSLLCIGEENGNPLQGSCLENPSDRGAWWAAVYGVAQSQTRLKRLSSSSPAQTQFSSMLLSRASMSFAASCHWNTSPTWSLSPRDSSIWQAQYLSRTQPRPVSLLSAGVHSRDLGSSLINRMEEGLTEHGFNFMVSILLSNLKPRWETFYQ